MVLSVVGASLNEEMNDVTQRRVAATILKKSHIDSLESLGYVPARSEEAQSNEKQKIIIAKMHRQIVYVLLACFR